MSEQWKNWNQQIIDEFRANGGKVGGRFEGANLLILRTAGVSRISGITRVVFVWYSPNPGALATISTHFASYSAPVISSAVTGTVSAPTSTSNFGFALRLWYQAGLVGRPALEATTTIEPSSSGK